MPPDARKKRACRVFRNTFGPLNAERREARPAPRAAERQAAYLASGPIRVQSAFGVRHVMRLVGSTVLLYSWVPDGAVDPLQAEIQPALETLGVAVPIPS